MPQKLDSSESATASHKSLLLFHLLIFTGKRYYLTELMEYLSCSKPTVLRLMEGIERSGVVALETGLEDRKRWYQIKSLPSRPYVSFSREEVEKLALCRDLLKYLLPEGMESVIAGGLGKVAALMDNVQERAKATAVKADRRLKGRIDYTPFQPYVDCLHKAISTHTVCAVTYKTPNKNPRVFEIVPVRLVVDEEVWCVEGWRVTDKGAPEIRLPITLAIQRIQDCVATRRSLENCPPLPEVRGAFGIPGAREEPFRTRIVFSEEYGEYIRERVWSEDQVIETLPDGSVELAFTVGSKYYLLSWLLQFGSSAELLEPETLRDELWEAAQALVDIYGHE
jgi:predicted DNA-binding transcriptional regulator YafY